VGHPSDSWELTRRPGTATSTLCCISGPAQSGLKVGSTKACLKGKFLSPGGATWTFFGCDSVTVITM
jgi:hypothetical protein